MNTIQTRSAPRSLDSAWPLFASARRSQPWENWGRTARCQPLYSFFPRSLEEIQQIVRFAREEGRSLRCVGQGHSWSTLVPTEDILLFVDHLNRVAMDLSDPQHPRLVLECGASVKEVNTVLEAHGFALPFNVVLESVRLGGLIATGSHGSGWQHQTLSDLVHAIEIVDASGNLRRFESGVDDEEVMSAARLNLGMFGVTYRLILDVQKSWRVHARDERLPIRAVLQNLEERVAAHDNHDLFWWPFNDQLWLKTWDRTEAPITARPRYSLTDQVGSALGARFLDATLGLSAAVPPLTPPIARAVFPFTPSRGDKVVDVVEAIHYRRSIEIARMGCIEVAFKIGDNFDAVRWAMQCVFERVDAYARRGEYPMNVTMNVRFIHNSDCLLSPAYGAGHTCYIEILSRSDPARWLAFSGEVGRDWLSLPQARPHWGKEFQHIPGVQAHLQHSLAEPIGRFNHVKARLGMDPDGIFLNPTLKEIFAP